MYQTDIAIIGAGNNGLMLANLLSEKFKITLIDKKSYPFTNTIEQVSAITPKTKTILKKYNLWEDIAKKSIITSIDLHNENSSNIINLEPNDIYQENLGYIVHNHSIQKALISKLNNKKNIQFLDEIKNFTLHEKNNTLFINQNRHIQYKILIIAAGHSSDMLTNNFIQTKKNYNQIAITTTIQTEFKHQNKAHQIFSPSGILALLPLEIENETSIVWSINKQEANYLINNQEQLQRKLQIQSKNILGKLKINNKINSFHLEQINYQDIINNNIARIGDSAHKIHPMSGLGLNIGFQDSLVLSNLLNKIEITEKNKIHQQLKQYQRQQQYEVNRINQAINFIHKYFQSRKKPSVQLVQHFIFKIIQNNQTIKHKILEHII